MQDNTWKMPISKIYVLSLITNYDRQEFIKQQFSEIGLEFEFIYGTDFYNLTNDSKNNPIIYPCTSENFKDARNFGCVMTHYQAVLQAFELGYKNVLIVEDDICFIKDKKILYQYLSSIPYDADFVTWDPRFLAKNFNTEQKDFLDLIKHYNGDYIFLPNSYKYLCGGMMYALMNRSTMELYLNNQRLKLKMSDHVDGFFENPTVTRYVCTKCLCTDQYNIAKHFNSEFSWYDNIYNKIDNLNIDDFYNPSSYQLFTRS